VKLKPIKIKGERFRTATGILLVWIVILAVLFVLLFSFSPSFTGFFAFNSPDEGSFVESASQSSSDSVSTSLEDTPKKDVEDSAVKNKGMTINVIREDKRVYKSLGGGSGSGGSGGGGGSGSGGNGGSGADVPGGNDRNETGNGSGGEEGIKNNSLSIFLLSPSENAGSNGKEIVFSYELTGQADNCSLVIDDKIVEEDSNVALGINNFTVFNLTKGKHFWGISCEANNSISSLKRRITVIATKNRFELMGDLEDIEKAKNLSLNKKGFGSVRFLDIINLSNCEDMEDHIIIDKNFISINSEKIPELNKPALVTFYSLDLKNPIVLIDGKPCLDCQVISKGGEVTFKVNHFSNYSLSENSALLIWDRTIGGSIIFYANYTNVTSASAIEGANCKVDFGDGDHQMNYVEGLYLYDSGSSGTGTATINCSAAGYTEFVLTDYFTLTSSSRVSGARVTAGASQTAPADDPESHSAIAGNVTYLTLYGYSITQAWQGYYGNVSGTIQLADDNDKVLYNWSTLTPNGEVYATRALDANFAAISCAGAGDISSEEASVGQSSDDVDSISNTFDAKSHPSFFVGSIQIPVNNCSSANLYDSGGEQSSSFYEVLLKDSGSNIIYTSILEKDKEGFDGDNYDFEMIVTENGHGNDTTSTTYYFYIEFG